MKFIAWFVRRPVATLLLLLSAVLSGLMALPRLPVSDLPDVDLPVISVSASNAGGSPEVMARTVAAPLERHLGNIAGVTQMQSTSTRGETSISLGFELGRDLNGAARDVEAAIRAARHDLPTTPGSDPSYHRANPNATPVLILAVTPGMQPMPRLYDLVNTTLRPMLLQVQGVGDVTLMGSSAPAVRVEMNPLLFFKYGMGFENLRAALASANAHTLKGVIDMGDRRYQLAVNDQAEHAAAYRDLVGSMIFLSLYYQLVLGETPAASGLMILPQVGAMMISSVLGGYHRRSRVETKMHYIKLLGQRLSARNFDRQITEVHVRIAVLNRFTALGSPLTRAVV